MATLTAFDMVKLRDEIPIERIQWDRLQACNDSIGALPLVMKHKDKINWSIVSSRADAVYFFEEHIDCLDWSSVSWNKAALHFLKRHPTRVHLDMLCILLKAPQLYHVTEKEQLDILSVIDECLKPHNLFRNPNIEKYGPGVNMIGSACDWKTISRIPAAIPLLKKYIYHVHWSSLGFNPNAKELLDYIQCVPTMDMDKQNVSDLYLLCSGPYSAPLIRANIEHFKDESFWIDIAKNNADMDFLEEHMDKLDWMKLSENKHAMPLFEKYPERLNWNCISANPECIPFIEKHLCKVGTTDSKVGTTDSKVKWAHLSMNKNAVHILEQNIGKIRWDLFSEHPEFIPFLLRHPETIKKYRLYDYIDWEKLSSMPSAIPLLEQYLKYVDWAEVSYHESMFPFLLKHPERIEWAQLSRNSAAISLLEENLDKIDWISLSYNKNAWPILSKHLAKVDWSNLSTNPVIFTYDYDKIKERCAVFKEELFEVVFHPRNYDTFASLGFEEFNSDVYDA
jgi:hypothetical protein